MGYREQPQILGRQPLPRGLGGLWLWDVHGWGRVGMQLWSLAASISSVPVLLHRCLRCLYSFPLHPHRTPDRAGSLPLFLQLHGLPCSVCSPGASTEVATAGRLCPRCGTFPASASTPDRPQALWQPSSLYAFGKNRGLRDPTVLLTITLLCTPVNSDGLSSSSLPRNTAREGLAGVPEISGIFVGD